MHKLKIVSGGQTGVDRAALDVALAYGLDIGGWCPSGRRAEDGRIADRYALRETPDAAYEQRTAWNVRDSDATLVIIVKEPSRGTAQTISEAIAFRKPFFIVHLDLSPDPDKVSEWLAERQVEVLNVAGPRESESPDMYERAKLFLHSLFEAYYLAAGASVHTNGTT